MLVQLRPQGKLCHVIQCSLHSLKPADANYTTIELECLAIQWAVEKCQYFLQGCGNFLIQTDHQPLIGVFQKPLREVANPQIFWFWEKNLSLSLPYSFDASWLPSKKNLIADVLSRNPCDVDYNGMKKWDDRCASDNCDIGIKAIITLGTATNHIWSAMASCADYQAINQAFELPDGHPVQRLGSMQSAISRIDGLLCMDVQCILIPRAAWKSIVALLHK